MPDEPDPEPEPSFRASPEPARTDRRQPRTRRARADRRAGQVREGASSLLTQCHRLLDQAEQSVALLTGVDEQGNPLTAPFDATATRHSRARIGRSPTSPDVPPLRPTKRKTSGRPSTAKAPAPSLDDPISSVRSTVLIGPCRRNAHDPHTRLWTIRWGHRVKYTGQMGSIRDFVLQSFRGSWVDFRRSNVNNSEAYEVARAWKTDERCVPESGVLGHQFVVSNAPGPVRSVHREQLTLKRWKHDEFSHDINRGVSAGRVSGRGAASDRGGLEWLLARG